MAVVNVPISDTFILRDNANAAITGKVSGDFATIEAYQVTSPGATAAVTLTEIGAGEYRISFTPTTPTSGSDLAWTAHVVYNSGGVFREFSETYTVTAVASTVTVVAAASSGAQLTTLGELRQEVADRFEDLVQLTATANGNAGKTTLIDTYHINDGTEHMNGRDLLATSGTNNGLRRRIIGTAKSTGTLTLNSALGDLAECSFSLDLAGTKLIPYVSASNTVTVIHRNDTGSTVDLGSGTLSVATRRIA